MSNATMEGNSTIMMDYNIINRHHKITVKDEDCKTNLTDNGVLNKTETETDLTNGFVKIDADLEINQTLIEASNVWNETTTGGEINFCTVVELFLNESSDVLVHFLETKFKIIVDKSTGFKLVRVELERTAPGDGGDNNINYTESIDAFRCDDDFVRDTTVGGPPKLNQGDILQICLEVEDATSMFEIEEVFFFNIDQKDKDLNKKEQVKVISNYGNTVLYPTLTEVKYADNDSNNQIGKVKFQLLGDFFEEEDPKDLEVTGSVKLQLKGNRRHLSIQDTARVLQSNEEATFGVKVGLGAAENDSGAWENSGYIASIAILTTILGEVYAM